MRSGQEVKHSSSSFLNVEKEKSDAYEDEPRLSPAPDNDRFSRRSVYKGLITIERWNRKSRIHYSC